MQYWRKALKIKVCHSRIKNEQIKLSCAFSHNRMTKIDHESWAAERRARVATKVESLLGDVANC